MFEDVFRWVFATWYQAFIGLWVFFNLLYWSITLSGQWLFAILSRRKGLTLVDNHQRYPGQVKTEIWQSMRSIFVFSLQGILIQQGLAYHIFQLSYELSWWVAPQMVLLFFWNEIHFYVCHVLLHTSFMIRNVHWVHHHSKEPTVFSTFSFHWLEAFLLGTVIFFPLLIYPFQAMAILSLPVMSLVINLLGHCNYDFFSQREPEHVLKFSYRHSMHHKKGRGNMGFLLPWLDNLFKTSIKSSK